MRISEYILIHTRHKTHGRETRAWALGHCSHLVPFKGLVSIIVTATLQPSTAGKFHRAIWHQYKFLVTNLSWSLALLSNYPIYWSTHFSIPQTIFTFLKSLILLFSSLWLRIDNLTSYFTRCQMDILSTFSCYKTYKSAPILTSLHPVIIQEVGVPLLLSEHFLIQ